MFLCRYLLATLDREKIRTQDVKLVMATVAANPEGRLLAWRHLRAHWSSIQSLFGNATIATGSLVSSIISQFSTQYDCKEVK